MVCGHPSQVTPRRGPRGHTFAVHSALVNMFNTCNVFAQAFSMLHVFNKKTKLRDGFNKAARMSS